MTESLNENAFKDPRITTREAIQRRHAEPVDMVNHPPHYTAHPAGFECIEVTRHANFNLGNAIKYVWRVMWGSKRNELQDLRKAVWYLQDEIKRREQAHHATNKEEDYR